MFVFKLRGVMSNEARMGRWSEISLMMIEESVNLVHTLVKILSIKVAVESVILVGLRMLGRK